MILFFVLCGFGVFFWGESGERVISCGGFLCGVGVVLCVDNGLCIDIFLIRPVRSNGICEIFCSLVSESCCIHLVFSCTELCLDNLLGVF